MEFLNKAKDFIQEHDKQVDEALEKAGDFADKHSPGHSEQIDKAVQEAQQRTGEGDQVP